MPLTMPPSTVHRPPSTVSDLHETEPRWFAVRTRAKCEKFVRQALAKKNVEAYVPLQQFVRRYERKTRTVEKPLITCYVFVQITKNEYLPVLETENVAGFVRIGKDLRAIPEAEIDLLRRITLEKDLELEVMEGAFHEGDWVEIVAGSLAGLRGRVVQREGKRRFQVELEQLGYSLLMQVDAQLLGKASRF
ncbi:MAG: UpxY family transcription antiterminator [Saprospiraceae bacterium]